MPKSPSNNSLGQDWTKLLSDPCLAGRLPELLQIYREAPISKRDQALREAIRRFKAQEPGDSRTRSTLSLQPAAPLPSITSPEATPPFEPDIFTPSWGEDRRRYPRLKCFVAVELRCEDSTAPIWGNLANTSMGGCLVETASPIPTGVNIQIGLWVANGKIWVKGFILNGVVTRSNPCFGVRIKFAEMGA